MSVNCGYCDEQFINNVQFIAHVKAVHVNEHDYAADEAFEPRRSGRVRRPPNRLEQERIEGKHKCTEKERDAMLRATLAKSERLTRELVRGMDPEEGDEENAALGERVRKRKRGPDGEEEAQSVQSEREINNWEQLVELEGRQFEGRPIAAEQPVLVSGGVMKGYQLEGLRWVARLRRLGANGILGDEMGLGKTIQTIAVFCRLYESELDAGPFLVIAPLSTITNWEREVQRFAPAAPVHLLYPKQEAEVEWWGRLDERTPCHQLGGRQLGNIFITSYDTAIGLRSMLGEVKWDFVVVDEGHRIKNRKCRLTTVLKSFDSTSRLLLTGTPLQNNMGELWALLNFLQPDIFDDYEIFESWFSARSLHLDEDEKDRLEAQEEEKGVLASIHRIIGPFMLRRVKAEVELGIPPKTEMLVYCPFTETQAGQYHMFQRLLVRTKAKAAKEEPMLGGNLGSYGMQYMMDLRSAVNHPYILGDPGTRDQAMIDCCGKLQVLDQMLTRLRLDGHKTLVFSQSTRLLDVICDYLKMKNMPYCLLDGRTPYLDRQMYVERFTNDPEVMVFLLSTRAGGLGINLVAADTCIIYDSDWNPQQDLQAQDRCHRIGQTKPVMVYRLVTKGTIDQAMVERGQAKRALERLVVQKDMFKSGARSLQSAGRKMEGGEIMRLILATEAAASCTAGQEAGGLEQEVLDRIMDRGNVQQGSEMTAGNMENNNVKLAKKLAKKVGTNLY